MIDRVTLRLRERVKDQRFESFFGPDVTLVAAPGHAPIQSDRQQSRLTLESIGRVTIVDDVVTTGATFLACAARLTNDFPHATILAFAAVRSLSGADQIQEILDPAEDGLTGGPNPSHENAGKIL